MLPLSQRLSALPLPLSKPFIHPGSRRALPKGPLQGHAFKMSTPARDKPIRKSAAARQCRRNTGQGRKKAGAVITGPGFSHQVR